MSATQVLCVLSEKLYNLSFDLSWRKQGDNTYLQHLYSYFRILKCEPYAKYKSFCNHINIPISRNSSQAYIKPKAVLKETNKSLTGSTSNNTGGLWFNFYSLVPNLSNCYVIVTESWKSWF